MIHAHTHGPYTACFARLDGQAFGFDITAQPWGSAHPIASYSVPLSKIHDVKPERSAAEIEATGNLFAAAPELLALVTEISRLPDLPDVDDSPYDLIRFAKRAKKIIAKAEGRT
jgi:hypothetical protein